MSAALESLVGERRIVIVVGPGGVGKTTTAAAIAADAAGRGLRAAVLTIDPARRLSDALGLETIGGEPRRVDGAALAEAGLGAGELWAMTLDAKQTFDRTVARHAPDAAARERILANPIYARISEALAGSQEYMAMEALHELAEREEFDLLVLDTPPSQQAEDFLTAPARILELIEGRAMRAFVRSAGLGSRIAGRGASLMFGLLRRITGVDLLRDLGEFFDAISGMTAGFAERADRVQALLRDPRSGFVIVTSPDPEPRAEALGLRARLGELGLPYEGAIVNRVAAPGPEGDPAQLAAQIAGATPGAPESLVAELGDALGSIDAESARHAAIVAELAERLGERPLLTAGRLADAPTDLGGLAALARECALEPAQRR